MSGRLIAPLREDALGILARLGVPKPAFARSGLAQYLTARGVLFEPFEDLNDVREALEA